MRLKLLAHSCLRLALLSQDIHAMELMQKIKKRALGTIYEVKAAEYLLADGYKILHQNVNYKWGEIDIVAEIQDTPLGPLVGEGGPRANGARAAAARGKGVTLVFVEVRKRDPRSWLEPEETLTFPKQRRLRSAIQSYLLKYQGRATSIRIDLVGFYGEELKHFRNFMPID